jgi:hypothetical protein
MTETLIPPVLLLHGRHVSPHSIVLSDRNALNLQRKYFSYMQKNRLADPSKICALDFKREFSAICGSLGFSNYRRLSVDFFCRPTDQAASRFSKKTVTRPRITRARRDTDIEPVERRLADARYLLLSRRHDKANRRPAQRR